MAARTKHLAQLPTPAQQLWQFVEVAPYPATIKALTDFWLDPRTTLADYAEMGRLDRFFLLVFLCERTDMNHPWIYERCREVQAEPYGYLDIWARWHGKSSLISFAGTVQELLNDPELTIAIFSFRKEIATKFVAEIKEKLEGSFLLKQLYPDILYDNPRRQAQTWSNSAITVKRKAARREPSVSAWGLIDGMPTSMHFDIRKYDDVITEKAVTNPEQIAKATDQIELSWNLGTHKDTDKECYIGTRYKFKDTYQILAERGVAKIRKHPATDNGTIDGKPVFMSQAKWEKTLRDTSLKNLAAQQLCDPMQGTDLMFKMGWLRYYELRPLTLNVYVMCDPARTKKKTSDRTGMAVVGIDYAWNKYLLDGLCHRLTLSQRWFWLNFFRRKWMKAPGVQAVKVGYEVYGAHADLEHFQEQMRIGAQKGERDASFPIEELRWNRDGPDSYVDRVQRLEPDLRNWRFFFPYDEMIDRQEFERRKLTADDTHGRHKQLFLLKTKRQRDAENSGSKELVARPIVQKDENGDTYALVDWMISNEYQYFPNIHVDFLDALCRLYDMEPTAPIRKKPSELNPQPEPD